MVLNSQFYLSCCNRTACKQLNIHAHFKIAHSITLFDTIINI